MKHPLLTLLLVFLLVWGLVFFGVYALGGMKWILIALGLYGLYLARGLFLAKITRIKTAKNVVLAALTYRSLDASSRNSVDSRVRDLCTRMGIRVESFGGVFPGNPVGHPDAISGANIPAVLAAESKIVYSFRALAMNELGIRPINGELPTWNMIRKPGQALSCAKEINNYRKEMEVKYRVALTELDGQAV